MRNLDFRERFGRGAELTAQAPGRVNLIGEHTDYNGGYVLPAAIPQRTRVEIALREDRRVRAWSASFPEEDPREYSIGEETAGRGWLDYIQGVTWSLRQEGFPLLGFDAGITSSVPAGGGLSSSASLEVAMLRALRSALGLPLSNLEIAKIAHRAETEFVGAPVGIMDQIACSLGSESAALFLDTRTLEIQRVSFPAPIELGVIDSGVRHSHAGGEYRVRRSECQEAARRLGVESLRDLEGSSPARWEILEEPLNRRVRHVVAENERVLKTVAALRSEDTRLLGEMLFASHASLRDDFEVSIPELDLLVELARAEGAILGARMTGGGFGGSVLMIGAAGSTREVARRIAGLYRERTGRTGRVILPSPEHAGES
jgi:galactokinase